MNEQLNNATNGEVSMVREWLENTRLITNRICESEMDELSAELAHQIFGYIKTHERNNGNDQVRRFLQQVLIELTAIRPARIRHAYGRVSETGHLKGWEKRLYDGAKRLLNEGNKPVGS